jgi:RNA polymerase sigma-70 factor (ECF subfamily)
MCRPINPADVSALQRIATEEAMRVCRGLGLAPQDRADLRQDLLADLLSRLPAYDPAKGTLGAFARVCLRHAACRIAQKHRQQRRVAKTVSLDEPLPGGVGLTLADVLSEADGYAAWCGQQTDMTAALERWLDLERAGSAIDPEDHPLCAALTTATPHEVAAQGAMPRARIYRRIREMRLRLLAAGIPSAA